MKGWERACREGCGSSAKTELWLRGERSEEKQGAGQVQNAVLRVGEGRV
jgi:hypothetical protein